MENELSGFSVAPNPNCPHVADSAFRVHPDLQPTTEGAEGKASRKNLFSQYQSCTACGDHEETWVCLACSYSGCSRYKKGHMVDHAGNADSSETHACIAISLSDLSVWCFQCDDYVVHPNLDKVFREMHSGKFGFSPNVSLHSGSQTEMTVTLARQAKKSDEDSAAD